MQFYKDNTYYSHCHFENARNIGWGSQKVNIGGENINAYFIEKLRVYLDYPFNILRAGSDVKDIKIGDKQYTLGYAEIRVLGENEDIRYAAPDIIYYNIINGIYSPPQEFIDAVINGVNPNSIVYQDYLGRYNPEYLWGEKEEYLLQNERILNIIKNEDIEELLHLAQPNKKFLNFITLNGSILNTAIIYAKENFAAALVDNRIDINMFNGIELLSAIEKGFNMVVEKLLKRNITIRCSELNENPLCVAIMNRNFNAVKMLVEKTGNLLFNVYSNQYVKNMTMVDLAKRYNNTEEVLHFLECKCE